MDYHNTLLSLLRDLKNEKTDLTREGQSFSPASLFSTIQGLMNLGIPCPSSDFQKIMDISTKLTNVNNLIEFCETILQKMKSTEEPLNPNEKTFLDYIYMVSQILGMTLELEKIQKSTDSNFSNYKRTFEFLNTRISERFDAFMNFMNYSYYWQRIVKYKKRTWETKNSGSPTIKSRTITPTEQIEIREKEDAKNWEINRLSDECQCISDQKTEFLERFCQLFALVSKPIRTFGLKSYPELSFFLSSFDPNHFDTFLSNFRMIDEKFQLLKTEIDAFNQKIESLREKCLKEYEKTDEYLDKWNSCISQGIPFYGKTD
jgi:hypothetical protein